jgi:hypothetical protein
MRALLVSLLLLALSPDGSACSCFPPELRAKTAADALQTARLAVFGRVLAVDASGKAKVLVLESFKGPAVGSEVEVLPNAGKCGTPPLMVGDEALVLAFDETATACDTHPPGHYLLEEFRLNAAKGK